MLKIENLIAGYGDTKILHDVSLHIEEGQIHALLGRNGVGKSTCLKAIMGLITLHDGDIWLYDEKIVGLETHHIARKSIAYVPETRDIFPSLSVDENLNLAIRFAKQKNENKTTQWDKNEILKIFPQLKNRLENGGQDLSGGEQQMLAIGRALLTNPKILILDEPTEGLAPIIVSQIKECLDYLKNQGMTMILVEQNFRFATKLANEISLMSKGVIVWHGKPQALINDKELQTSLLGV